MFMQANAGMSHEQMEEEEAAVNGSARAIDPKIASLRNGLQATLEK